MNGVKGVSPQIGLASTRDRMVSVLRFAQRPLRAAVLADAVDAPVTRVRECAAEDRATFVAGADLIGLNGQGRLL